ncbi:MAG TPA: NAD(P)/FAD-dependent oxidoreductase [Fodinibius sp.]|nr:NAD(P)/FAD-dependent oxidoreductase [Fodinibius sp.]
MKNIVVIGGGFAGINMAKKLKNKDGIHVTLVDKNNYNFFTPLLYQVATGMLDVSSISTPFRTLLKKAKNFDFRLGELQAVHPEENKVQLSTGQLSYDVLVMATGTKANFFGMDNIEQNALPMKSIDQAVELRNYLLQKAEEATYTTDGNKRAKLHNIIISGAGPSGVEVTGMIAEMSDRIMDEIYPEISEEQLGIYLVDGAPTVLPPMREKSQKYTYKKLQEMGVRIGLEKMVTDYKDHTVYFKDGDTIKTETLIWTAGVTGMRFDGLADDWYGKGSRLLVDKYNKVQGSENIYAIGDACLQKTDENFPDGHPQLATIAMQQGTTLAKNLVARKKGQDLTPFSYNDRGSMAIIGKSRATADLTTPNKTFTGWFAWMMWLFVHLFQLIGYRNRFKTMWDWTTAYVTQDQSLGMIIRSSGQTSAGKSTLEKKLIMDTILLNSNKYSVLVKANTYGILNYTAAAYSID